MEASELWISSLTVNSCVLLYLILAWVLRRRQRLVEKEPRQMDKSQEEQEQEQEREQEAEDSDSEKELKVKKPKTKNSIAIDVFLLVEIATSLVCFGAGLYMMTSSYVWQCPFICRSQTSRAPLDVIIMSPPTVDQSSFGVFSASLLSVAFGTFIFKSIHLAFVSCSSATWNLWSVVRTAYLVIGVVTIGVILLTKENFLGAGLVLMMEIDAAVEAVCQLVDRCSGHEQVPLARQLLSAVGCATSLGTRVVMTWVMCLSVGRFYNPIAMSVMSLGVASFGIIFFQAYTLLVLRQHVVRIKKILKQGRGNQSSETVLTEVESFQNRTLCYGSRKPSGKDVAFYVMNERLIEMSSYAKTIAGAITGKQLKPIKHLCENIAQTQELTFTATPSLK